MLDELLRRTRELKSAAENYLCVEKMRDDLTAFEWYGENVMLLADSYSEWIGLDDSPNAVGCKAVLSEAIILREACGDVSVATCAETVESLLLAVGLVERRLTEVDVARKIQSKSEPELTERQKDAPLDGNRFLFDGTIHDMSPVPWRLLNAMWGQDQRDMHTVEDEVWDVPGDNELRNGLSQLKKFLEAIGYPQYVSKSRRSDFLVWKEIPS